MRIKYYFVITVIALLATISSGCEKKNDTPVSTAPTESIAPTSTEQEQQQGQEQTIPTQQITVGQEYSDSQTNYDGITAIFEQNLSIAQENSQSVIGANSKLCFASIEYIGGIIDERGITSFYFENDEVINGYYWVVELNGYKNNQMKRHLSVKKDWEGEITCTTLSRLSEFTSGYEFLVRTKEINTNLMLGSVKTIFTLSGDSWQIDMIGPSGETLFSKNLSQTENQGTVPSQPTP